MGHSRPSAKQAVGYGAGRRDLEAIPNLLRLRLGERAEASERVLLIEANIDDMNPEVYGYLFDRLLERGACDVYATPVLMKKGRPGNVLSVLAPAGPLGRTGRDRPARNYDHRPALLRGGTPRLGTPGLQLLPRPYGEVGVKFSRIDGRGRAAPEYEDCARLAQEHQVPLLSVYEAARAAATKE